MVTIRLAADGPQLIQADTLVVEHPDPADEVIARHADPERLAWMHANFTDYARVTALGGC